MQARFVCSLVISMVVRLSAVVGWIPINSSKSSCEKNPIDNTNGTFMDSTLGPAPIVFRRICALTILPFRPAP